ncbi:MAG: hypothetical protein FWE08_06165 [Oscillospiraceae bacterium]|nr:hypothetical protein [Oscillospiraceae bacterium]
MTPTFLLEDMKAELERLFAGHRLRNSLGDEKPIAVHIQDLPIREGPDRDGYADMDVSREQFGEEPKPPEPYILLRAKTGKIEDAEADHHVSVVILMCVADKETERNGHVDVLHLIHRVYERFAKNPVLNDKYIMNYPVDWSTVDEDTYPYYFGGMTLGFNMAAIRRIPHWNT